MKTMTIAMLFAVTGCSDEADIGVNSEPVRCSPDTAGPFVEVSGDVTDPGSGTHYTFDSATPQATPTNLTLLGESNQLRFGFYCGAAERAKYGVKGDTQEGLDCPLEVASVVLGRIEYLPAKSGTLIIDENSNCLAGRFRVDFGSNGSIDGKFMSYWQQTP